MCYVGKATKIFIFMITLLLVTAIVLGLGILRHGKSHKCSDNSCHQTQSPADFPSPTVLNPGLTPLPPPTEVIAAPPPTFGPPSPVLVTPASYGYGGGWWISWAFWAIYSFFTPSPGYCRRYFRRPCRVTSQCPLNLG